jgi:hypothetical protein
MKVLCKTNEQLELQCVKEFKIDNKNPMLPHYKVNFKRLNLCFRKWIVELLRWRKNSMKTSRNSYDIFEKLKLKVDNNIFLIKKRS